MEYRLRAPSAQRFLMALSKMTQGDIERSLSLPEVCSRAKLPEDEVGEFKSEVLGWLQRDGMIILKDDRVKITNSGIFASQGSWEVPSGIGSLSDDELNKYMLALFQYILQKHNSGVRDGLVIGLPQMYKDKFEGWNYDGFLKTRDRLKEEGLISIRNDDSYILYNIFDFLGRSERLTDYNPT